MYQDNLEIENITEKLKPYIENFANLCKVDVCIIDNKANTIFSLNSNKNRFCDCAKKIVEINCEKVHLYGSYEAERFGNKYIFFCPIGLTHFVSPIIIDGEVKASIIAGPVSLVDRTEFLEEDIFSKYKIDDECKKELINTIKTVPNVSPDKLKSMSEMLFIIASYANSYAFSKEDENKTNQQSEISAILHSIKQSNSESQTGYPIDKEKELISAIAEGDKKASKRLLNEILGYVFFTSGGDFSVIKARVVELIVLLSRAALEGGADVEQIFGLNYTYLNEINLYTTTDDLAMWLSKIMNRFTDYVFYLADIKRADVVFKATGYIKDHYMTKISLDDVANYVFLSPSYFSKVFKEQTGNNFNNYLNELRIKKSKLLLMDPSVSIIEIASMVGYEDQSYFSKVFKKYTGVTPKKFRECRGFLNKNM